MVNLQVLLRNPWGKMTFGDTHQKKKRKFTKNWRKNEPHEAESLWS